MITNTFTTKGVIGMVAMMRAWLKENGGAAQADDDEQPGRDLGEQMQRRDWYMLAALVGILASQSEANDELLSSEGDGRPMFGLLSQWCRLATFISFAAMAHLDDLTLSPFEYAKRFRQQTQSGPDGVA